MNVAVAIAQQVADFLCRGAIQNAVNVPVALARGAAGAAAVPRCWPRSSARSPAQLVARAAARGDGAGERRGRGARDCARSPRPCCAGSSASILESGVNYVNAPAIARERGIRVIESRAAAGERLPERARASQVRTASRTTRRRGRGLRRRHRAAHARSTTSAWRPCPRATSSCCTTATCPGVVGRVGTLLGERGINIAGLELGRERVGGMALSLIHVDDAGPGRRARPSCARCRRSSRRSCSASDAMPATVVIGTQWGDEGKGKVVDLLAARRRRRRALPRRQQRRPHARRERREDDPEPHPRRRPPSRDASA